jgi:transcriptional regulator with XRE-family HTH domain
MHPGNRIREIRKAAGLTQAELGERTGFGQDSISNYENGRRPLRLNELRVLARELTCAPADLLDDSDNPERLSGEERRLLQAFRDSSQDAKSFLLASAQAVSTRQDAA